MGNMQGNTSPLRSSIFVNTTRENIDQPRLISQKWGGGFEQNNVAHVVVDKCKIGRRNQMQQTVHKSYTANLPSKSNEAVRMRSGQLILKPHRPGIDA